MKDEQAKPGEISRKGAELRAASMSGGNADRDALLRETYRLNYELGYVGFRHQYFNDPAAIEEWPDPAVREIELRDFWETGGCDSVGEGFASYRKSHADVPVEVLTAHRDHLRAVSAGSKEGQIAYYHRISELGRNGRVHDDGSGKGNAARTAVTGNHSPHSSLTPPAGWSQAADQQQPGNEHIHDNGHDKGNSM